MHAGTNDNLQITVICSGDHWVLRLEGSLDLATGRQLTELGDLLGEGAPGDVDLDLGGIDFVDTAGLHAVAATCRAIRAAHGRASITGPPSPALTRLLHALDGCGPTADVIDLRQVRDLSSH